MAVVGREEETLESHSLDFHGDVVRGSALDRRGVYNTLRVGGVVRVREGAGERGLAGPLEHGMRFRKYRNKTF
jgi:hypothetical protein